MLPIRWTCRRADEPSATAADKAAAIRACLQLGEVPHLPTDREWRAVSVAAYEEARTRAAALVAARPNDPDAVFLLARAHKCLAHTGLLDSDLAAAVREGTAAAELLERLVEQHPKAAEYRNPLSDVYGALAEAARRQGRYAEAVRARKKGLESDEWLRDHFPRGHPLSYIRLAITWIGLAEDHATAGDLAEAEAAYREAVRYDDHVRREFPEPKTNRQRTFFARLRLVGVLLARRKDDEAERELAVATPDVADLVRTYPDRHQFVRFVCWPHYLLGQRHYLAGRTEEAKAAFRTAIELSRSKPEVDPEWRVHVRVYQPFPDLVSREELTQALAPPEGGSWSPLGRLLLAVLSDDRKKGEEALADPLPPDATPETEGVYRHLEALHHARCGRADRAREVLAEPDRWDKHFTDGRLRVYRKQIEEAIKAGR